MTRAALRICAATAILLLTAMLEACSSRQNDVVTATTLPDGLKPAASIIDLMQDPIDSSASFLWDAVSTVTGPAGVEEQQPRTDAEWKAVRRRVLLLMEAANLLTTQGRVVAHPGQQLEQPVGQYDLTPEQVQAEIDRSPAVFVAFASALQISAGELLAAIERRDVESYLHAGGTLDEVCEGCHQRYWYPDSPGPPGQ